MKVKNAESAFIFSAVAFFIESGKYLAPTHSRGPKVLYPILVRSTVLIFRGLLNLAAQAISVSTDFHGSPKCVAPGTSLFLRSLSGSEAIRQSCLVVLQRLVRRVSNH